ARARASGTALHAACHHWAGSCSAQPGWGWAVSSGDVAKAAQVPRSSNRAARTLCVPTSRPRNSGEALRIARADRSVLPRGGEPVLKRRRVVRAEARPVLRHLPGGDGFGHLLLRGVGVEDALAREDHRLPLGHRPGVTGRAVIAQDRHGPGVAVLRLPCPLLGARGLGGRLVGPLLRGRRRGGPLLPALLRDHRDGRALLVLLREGAGDAGLQLGAAIGRGLPVGPPPAPAC